MSTQSTWSHSWAMQAVKRLRGLDERDAARQEPERAAARAEVSRLRACNDPFLAAKILTGTPPPSPLPSPSPSLHPPGTPPAIGIVSPARLAVLTSSRTCRARHPQRRASRPGGAGVQAPTAEPEAAADDAGEVLVGKADPAPNLGAEPHTSAPSRPSKSWSEPDLAEGSAASALTPASKLVSDTRLSPAPPPGRRSAGVGGPAAAAGASSHAASASAPESPIRAAQTRFLIFVTGGGSAAATAHSADARAAAVPASPAARDEGQRRALKTPSRTAGFTNVVQATAGGGAEPAGGFGLDDARCRDRQPRCCTECRPSGGPPRSTSGRAAHARRRLYRRRAVWSAVVDADKQAPWQRGMRTSWGSTRRPDLPPASAGSDMIRWSRVLLSRTLDATRSY